MRSTRAALLLVLGASLVLMTGCGDQLPEDLPDVIGLQGFLNNGWDAFEAQNYDEALEYFEQAIEADLSCAEAYLGAGWSCLYLTDYWGKANDYFFMALQLDGGQPPLVEHLTEVKVQDTDFSVFELIDDKITPEQVDTVTMLYESIGETWNDWPFPGDTTLIYVPAPTMYMVGFDGDTLTFVTDTDTVGPDLGNVPLQYRFQVANSGILTCIDLDNVPLALNYHPDSVSGGYVYVSVPMEQTPIDDAPDLYEWIMPDMQCNYDYVTLDVGESYTQISKDAMAGWTLLQQLRGENGNALMGVANGQALATLFDSYTFDEGGIYGTNGVQLELSLDQLAGNAALTAYAEEDFIYAWFLCKKQGVGLGLDPEAAGFELQLIQVIEDLVQGS